MDADLAEVVATALESLAKLVGGYDDTLTGEDPRVRAVEDCMARLTEEFSRRRDLDADDVVVLGAVVANLRRATSAIHPEGTPAFPG